jgi:hypothetical protein
MKRVLWSAISVICILILLESGFRGSIKEHQLAVLIFIFYNEVDSMDNTINFEHMSLEENI